MLSPTIQFCLSAPIRAHNTHAIRNPFHRRSFPRPKFTTDTSLHSREKSYACVTGPEYTYLSFSGAARTVPRIRMTTFAGDRQSVQVRSRGRGRAGAAQPDTTIYTTRSSSGSRNKPAGRLCGHCLRCVQSWTKRRGYRDQ